MIHHTMAINIEKGVRTKEDSLLRNTRFIEASDVFLKEIELKVGENIDFNKDQQEIQRLLQKFQDMEREVHSRERVMIRLLYRFHPKQNDYSEQGMDDEMMSNIVTLNNQLEEMKKLLSLISEMKDRKIKVEQRLIELRENSKCLPVSNLWSKITQLTTKQDKLD